ncbi:hypothetical protein AF6_1173 [Anoxybacillus flavithermus TNO-09.006]|nr:hypothetical protein AF6_1173 [Anoxybacillus flavithermus TNO-09.006]
MEGHRFHKITTDRWFVKKIRFFFVCVKIKTKRNGGKRMKWEEIRQAFPNRWVLIEAVDAYKMRKTNVF